VQQQGQQVPPREPVPEQQLSVVPQREPEKTEKRKQPVGPLQQHSEPLREQEPELQQPVAVQQWKQPQAYQTRP
jgi:hypothetical protein